MYNTLNRVQNVFGYFTTVAFAVAAVIAASVVFFPQNPKASLELRNVQVVKGRPHYYSAKREEYAHVKFDLDADLSSLFNWNTKQVFLYITASYPSSDPSTTPPSESVVWDAIIPSDLAPFHPNTYIHPTRRSNPKNARPKNSAKGKAYPPGTKPGIVKLSNQKPKYQITDISGKIAEREDATLTLHWNVQPWVGLLVWDSPKTFWRWESLKGGAIQFAFPPLKGAEVKKEELKTERGAERNRGSPA